MNCARKFRFGREIPPVYAFNMSAADTIAPETVRAVRHGFDEPMHPVQIAAMRRLTLSQRFARGLHFLRSAQNWLVSGIRARHPDWSEDQIAAEVRRAVTNAGN